MALLECFFSFHMLESQERYCEFDRLVSFALTSHSAVRMRDAKQVHPEELDGSAVLGGEGGHGLLHATVLWSRPALRNGLLRPPGAGGAARTPTP